VDRYGPAFAPAGGKDAAPGERGGGPFSSGSPCQSPPGEARKIEQEGSKSEGAFQVIDIAKAAMPAVLAIKKYTVDNESWNVVLNSVLWIPQGETRTRMRNLEHVGSQHTRIKIRWGRHRGARA